MDEFWTCRECGGLMIITDVGVSHHVFFDETIDFDTDADHVAVSDKD